MKRLKHRIEAGSCAFLTQKDKGCAIPSSLSVSEAESARLFAYFHSARALVLGVSGGVDSSTLLWLMSRWRRECGGPPIYAVTVNHGLRPAAAAEAASVAALAERLGVPHEIVHWGGARPRTGIEAAARTARYRLLRDAAARHGASHIVTAHTQDDQAETVLMRLAAGSGPSGLAAMRPLVWRGDVLHARPLLGVERARLAATLHEAGVAWCEDPMNTDAAYARPRLRAARAALEREGLTAGRLATFAARMARHEDALARAAGEAWNRLAREEEGGTAFAVPALLGESEEIVLRLLGRAVERHGDGTRQRLERLERFVAHFLACARADRSAGRTLGGAQARLGRGVLRVTAAPPRRGVAVKEAATIL
jgi:tRNA(Ile)-lysidine synthase